jgi:hypothetical protein
VGIVNRRNAVVGWAVWTLARRMLKREEKGKAVGKKPAAAKKKRRMRTAIAFLAALAVGAATYLRARSGGESVEGQ